MSAKTTRILGGLAGLLLIFYIFYHTVFLSYSSVKTESAINYTAGDSISATAYIIRNEQVITTSYSGVRSYSVADGGRVANGGTVAEIYSSASDVSAKAKADSLSKQIENLTELKNMNINVVADIDQINGQIEDQLIRLLNATDDGNYASLGDYAEDYFDLLNRRMVATGKSLNFDAQIAQLTAERDSLLSQIGGGQHIVTSQNSGYFVSKTDGYESVLSIDMIDSLTPESFESIKPEDISGRTDIVGKTVGGVDWYVAVKIGFEDALKFSDGRSVKLNLPLSSISELPVTVFKIAKSASTGEAVVIFKCSYMNGELACIRTQPVKIVLDSYTGLRVDNRAIRISNGVKGVYRKIGSRLEFVEIETIYTGNGFVICKMAESQTNGLYLYDEVVVKGKNLYDGKTVG